MSQPQSDRLDLQESPDHSDQPTRGSAGEEAGAVALATLVEADDLVEEISIDGMCGVY